MYLIFAACLLSNPETCRVRSIQIFEPVSEMTCLMQGQPTLAQWTYDHPEWSVKKWQCSSKEPGLQTAGDLN
ncbi:MAG: hypothetical protein KDA73_09450 [Rhodobacteraceae bacterium]|nr:hypothetical protein [Paracoccaceae bacterium]